MFIFSVRSRQFRLFAVLFVLVILVAVCSVAVMSKKNITEKNDNSVKASSEINYSAENEEEIRKFIEQFGWQINSEPTDICEVIIPVEFDEVYTQYNEIQLEQGLDLSKYGGKRVKKKSYAVINYKGYENNDDCIRINLLIFNGKVIGGDVCNIELGGFMHGFSYPDGV